MRTVSSKWNTTLTRSHQRLTTVTAGRPGNTRDLPIIDGRLDFDSSTPSTRRTSITVPRVGPDGFVWDPGDDPLHPLAPFGQRLAFSMGVLHSDSTTELLNMGSCLITEVETPDADTIQVTGMDLFELIQQALTSSNSYQGAWPSGTILSDIAGALNDVFMAFPVTGTNPLLPFITEGLSPATLAAPIPLDKNGGEERADLMAQIAELWPAKIDVKDDGTLRFSAPVNSPGTSVYTISSGVGGTLVTNSRNQTREESPLNLVSVGKVSVTTGQITTSADLLVSGGNFGYSTPHGLRARYYWSTAIPDNARCVAIRDRIYYRSLQRAQTRRVECVPNPALQLWDTVTVNVPNVTPFVGLVTGISLPLTNDGGPMQLDVAQAVT